MIGFGLMFMTFMLSFYECDMWLVPASTYAETVTLCLLLFTRGRPTAGPCKKHLAPARSTTSRQNMAQTTSSQRAEAQQSSKAKGSTQNLRMYASWLEVLTHDGTFYHLVPVCVLLEQVSQEDEWMDSVSERFPGQQSRISWWSLAQSLQSSSDLFFVLTALWVVG
jgi:hypothetical protein